MPNTLSIHLNYNINDDSDIRLEYSSDNSFIRIFNDHDKKMTVYGIKDINKFLSHTAGCVIDNTYRNEIFRSQEKEAKNAITAMDHVVTTKLFDSSAHRIISCLAQKSLEEVEDVMNNGGALLLYAYYTEAQNWYKLPNACEPFELANLDINACAESLPADDVIYPIQYDEF